MFVFYALAKVPLSLVGTLMDSAYNGFWNSFSQFQSKISLTSKNCQNYSIPNRLKFVTLVTLSVTVRVSRLCSEHILRKEIGP